MHKERREKERDGGLTGGGDFLSESQRRRRPYSNSRIPSN
jgi:hypothetical protein